MEYADTDSLKSQLLRKASLQKANLEGEVKLISDRTQQVLVNALVIGGSLALAYLLVRKLTDRDEKPKVAKVVAMPENRSTEAVQVVTSPEPESLFERLSTRVVSQASEMLLALAKEKLVELLDTHHLTATETKAQNGNT